MKIAVIGGGASGLMAAIAAKTEDNEVVILEKESRVGRKILATGNGRCNLTNLDASPENYHGTDTSFLRGAMSRFWVRETLDFFTECGLLWKAESGGKVYPYSDTAASVLDVLRRRAARAGVETVCGYDVKSVTRRGGGFIIEPYGGKRRSCDRVIIAGGGRAAPSLGSNGSCYKLLEGFGHTITELSPSLVQIKTVPEVVKKLKGIKVNAELTINERSETGEVLFTDYGLSGPPVFFLSAYADGAKTAELDIMPDFGFNELLTMLADRCAYLYDVPLEDYFVGMINKRVGQAILKSAGLAPLSRPSGALTMEELKRLVGEMKHWRFEITGRMSWNNAQVTRGGALTSQFDSGTMESKLVKGLYACGEVLDIDGDCGGFNLQWAWSSGYLAGRASSA